jgi:hypothetical protein
MRREAGQLAFFAVLTAAALLSGSSVLTLIAGFVDLVGLLLATVAALVAWRAVGRRSAVLVYVVAAIVFAGLAALNFAH